MRGDRRTSRDSWRRGRGGEGRAGQVRTPWGGSHKGSGALGLQAPLPFPWAPWVCHLWMLIIHDAGALPGFNAL